MDFTIDFMVLDLITNRPIRFCVRQFCEICNTSANPKTFTKLTIILTAPHDALKDFSALIL